MKTVITWQEDFKTNIEIIDEQHKYLIQNVNALFDALENGDDSENIVNLIYTLAECTDLHFSTEEELMEKFKYYDYEEHKKEHEFFKKRTENLHKSLISGELEITVSVIHFLKDWYNGHITETDKKLGQYLYDRGLR